MSEKGKVSATCPRRMCKQARRYTRRNSHQFATGTSDCTWRWYSIFSAEFRRIAPSSPAACQTIVTQESHNPVTEGHEEYWSTSVFKEAELACFSGCSCGSWKICRFFFFPHHHILFASVFDFLLSLLKRKLNYTSLCQKNNVWAPHISSFILSLIYKGLFCQVFTHIPSIFPIIPPLFSSTSLILNDE